MEPDEDVLNILLAEGVDAPTAYAAILPDQPASPPENRAGFAVAVLLGVLAVLAWQLIH